MCLPLSVSRPVVCVACSWSMIYKANAIDACVQPLHNFICSFWKKESILSNCSDCFLDFRQRSEKCCQLSVLKLFATWWNLQINIPPKPPFPHQKNLLSFFLLPFLSFLFCFVLPNKCRPAPWRSRRPGLESIQCGMFTLRPCDLSGSCQTTQIWEYEELQSRCATYHPTGLGKYQGLLCYAKFRKGTAVSQREAHLRRVLRFGSTQRIGWFWKHDLIWLCLLRGWRHQNHSW